MVRSLAYRTFQRSGRRRSRRAVARQREVGLVRRVEHAVAPGGGRLLGVPRDLRRAPAQDLGGAGSVKIKLKFKSKI